MTLAVLIRAGGVVASCVVALSAFLPWGMVWSVLGPMSISGIEGDGVLTLIGAVVMGVLIGVWKRVTLILAAVVAALVSLIAIVDLVSLQSRLADLGLDLFVRASPGYGLYLTAVGAVLAMALAIVGAIGMGRAVPAQQPAVVAAGPLMGGAWSAAAGPGLAGGGQGFGGGAGLGGAGLSGSVSAPWATEAGQGLPGGGQAFAVGGQAFAGGGQAFAGGAATHTAASTPAGWFADPFGQAHLRYWDGSRWTEHVQGG